jgi:TP901 family phage tail tape measure protein
MALRFDVQSNIRTVSKDYRTAAKDISQYAREMTLAQEALNRAIKAQPQGKRSVTSSKEDDFNAEAAQRAARAWGAATTAREKYSAAQRQGKKDSDEAAAAAKREEAAIQARLRLALQTINSYGGEHRAYVLQINDSIRRAKVAQEEINYTKLLADARARLAATKGLPAQLFTKENVEAKSLTGQLLGMQNVLSSLVSSFGVLGPTALTVFHNLTNAVVQAKKEMSEYIASVKIGMAATNFEGAGSGSAFPGTTAAATAAAARSGAFSSAEGAVAGTSLAKPSASTAFLASLATPEFLIPAAVIGASVAALAKLISIANEIEKAFDEVSAITGITGDKLNDLTEDAIRLSVEGGQSITDVAQAIKLIASSSPELIETEDGLQKVTQASLLLSRASGDELAASVTTVTSALAQFGLGAGEASRVVDALAAGSKVGAVEVPALGEALARTGAVARSAGIPLEDLIALIETVGKSKQPLDIVETSIRNLILRLQTSGRLKFGDDLGDVLRKLKQDGLGAEEILKLLGERTITTGRFLLNEIDTFERYRKGIRETGVAMEQAETRTDNLGGSAHKLGVAWDALMASIAESKALEGTTRHLKNLLDLVTFALKIPLPDKKASESVEAIDRQIAEKQADLARYERPLKPVPSLIPSFARIDDTERRIRRAQLIRETEEDIEELVKKRNAAYARLTSIPDRLPQPPDPQADLIEEGVARTRTLTNELDTGAAAMTKYKKYLEEINELQTTYKVTNGQAGLSEAEATRLKGLAAAATIDKSKASKDAIESLKTEEEYTKRVTDANQSLRDSIRTLASQRKEQDEASARKIADIETETKSIEAQRAALARGSKGDQVHEIARLRADAIIQEINLQREAQRQALRDAKQQHDQKLKDLFDEFSARQNFLVIEKQITAEEAKRRIASARGALDRETEISGRRYDEEIAKVKDLAEAEKQHIYEVVLANEQVKKSLELEKSSQQRIQNALEAPWKNAVENIQKAFGDKITSMLDKLLGHSKGFLGDLLDLFKRFAAELLTVNIFGGVFGQLGQNQVGQSGGLSGIIGQLLGSGGGSGGGLLNIVGGLAGTLFGSGSSAGGIVVGLDDETTETLTSAVRLSGLSTQTGLAGLAQRLGSFVGLGAGGTSNAGFLSVGNLFSGGLGGGGFGLSSLSGSLGGAGALALPLLGYGLGQNLGVPGVSRTLITAGLTGVGAAAAGGYGAAALTSTLGGIGTAISGLSSILGPIGLVLAAIGFGYGNIVGGNSAGAQAGRFAKSGENPYAQGGGNRSGSASTAFRVGLQTGSLEFAIAAGIGAMQKLPQVGFGFQTGAPGISPGGFESAGPFGTVGVAGDSVRSLAGPQAQGFVGAIAQLDAAIAKFLSPEEIARVTERLQKNDILSSFFGRPKYAEAGFTRIIAERLGGILSEVDFSGAGVQEAFRARVNPNGAPVTTEQTLVAFQDFLTALRQVGPTLDALAGKEIPAFTSQVAQIKQALEEAKAKFGPYGIELQRFTDAATTGINKLAQDSINADKLAILSRFDPLQAALIQQSRDAEKAIENARAIEAETGLTAVVYAEQRAALERLQIVEDFTDRANASLRQLREQLTIGTLGQLSIPTRFANAQTAFEEDRIKLLQNPRDIDQRNETVQSLNTLIGLASEEFGSGKGFQDVREMALEFLNSIEENIGDLGSTLDIDSLSLFPTGDRSIPTGETAITFSPEQKALMESSLASDRAEVEVSKEILENLKLLVAGIGTMNSKLDSLSSDMQRALV